MNLSAVREWFLARGFGLLRECLQGAHPTVTGVRLALATRRRSGPEGTLAIIRRSDGAVLMQLRDDRPDIAWPGYWTILGGGVEEGETSASAVVREVHEESGLRVSNLTLITHVVDKAGSGQRLAVYEAFMPDDIELRLGEGRDLRFVGDEERRQLRIPPFVSDLLDTYVRS